MGDITFYMVTDDKRKLSKNKLNEFEVTKTFRLKENCDVLNPVFEISKKTMGEKAFMYNYCYIPLFSRYYFINKIITKSNAIIEYSCHVDVLENASAELKTKSAYVLRQENLYNKYIIDNEVPTSCERAISFHTIGKIGTSNGSYIAMTVSGGEE